MNKLNKHNSGYGVKSPRQGGMDASVCILSVTIDSEKLITCPEVGLKDSDRHLGCYTEAEEFDFKPTQL